MKVLAYAGIGSRKTPEPVLSYMYRLGKRLAQLGYLLRSGAANGADHAFENGADAGHGKKEIWLPWLNFNDHPSTLCPTREAYRMAESIHPRWELLTSGAKALHARNCHQILGSSLDDPVKFCVCWTEDGCEEESSRTPNTGGTGTAIVLASRYKVPIFNLGTVDGVSRLNKFMESNLSNTPNAAELSPSDGILKEPFVLQCIELFDAKIISMSRISSR